jgi:hypothetical protein
MSRKLSLGIVHDVNAMRQSLKAAFKSHEASAASATTPHSQDDAKSTFHQKKSMDILVLPIGWRHQLSFDVQSEGRSERLRARLEDITLEGAPNFRMIVSDVLLDGECLSIDFMFDNLALQALSIDFICN